MIDDNVPVKAGDVLVQIDARPYQAEVGLALILGLFTRITALLSGLLLLLIALTMTFALGIQARSTHLSFRLPPEHSCWRPTTGIPSVWMHG